MAIKNPIVWLAGYFSELKAGDQLQVDPGTSGAPGLTFRGANTSGIYEASGVVGIGVSGTDVARFTTATGLNMFGTNIVIDQNRVFRLRNYVVASLPASPPDGCIAFVTDSTQTLTAGIGTAVVGGGANKVPVYADGGTWKIG